MKNEGWVYIVESKLNNKKIKVGITKQQTPEKRLKNYEQYGGIKIILSCKYNNIRGIEKSLHQYLSDFFDTDVDGKEWFDLSKKSGQKYLYKICPLLFLSAIDVYKGTSFDYSNEFWEKFDNWLKEHSNDDCKEHNSFLKNKDYTDYKKFVLKSTNEKNNKSRGKPKQIKQPKPQGKVCKYETKFDSIGRPDIDWDLFFEDHKKKLVGKKVYPSKQPNNVAKLVKLKTPIKKHNYGILYENKEMSFGEFATKTIKPGLNPFDSILFCESNKTIKQTYNELKFK